MLLKLKGKLSDKMFLIKEKKRNRGSNLMNNSCKDHLDKQRGRKLDLVQDQDQQYKISLRIGGKLKG